MRKEALDMTRRTFLKVSAVAFTSLFVGLPPAPQKEEQSILQTVLSVEKGIWTVFRAEYYVKQFLFASRAAKRIFEKVKEVFA